MVNAALAVRDDRAEQARLLAQAAGVAQQAGRSADALRWLHRAGHLDARAVGRLAKEAA